MLRKLFYLACLIGGLLCLTLIYLVNTVINRPNFVAPGQLSDPEHKDFTATSADGINIQATFYEGAVNADTVLLCHGHGVNLTYMDDMVKFLRDAGYNLLLLDFRAHGRSGGKLCPIGLHEWNDIKAVLTKARELGYLKAESSVAA
ncbi:MAG: peptidase S15, partial [uncultured bacterium]